jgi:hypothetical protein
MVMMVIMMVIMIMIMMMMVVMMFAQIDYNGGNVAKFNLYLQLRETYRLGLRWIPNTTVDPNASPFQTSLFGKAMGVEPRLPFNLKNATSDPVAVIEPIMLMMIMMIMMIMMMMMLGWNYITKAKKTIHM